MKTLPAKWIRVCAFATILAACLSSGVQSRNALAAPVTAAGGYYAESKSVLCSGSGCSANLTAVPGGKVLIVDRVSCRFTVTATGSYAITHFSLLQSPLTL